MATNVMFGIPGLGNTVTIGKGGMYPTPESYLSILRATNQLTPITAGSFTCTVTQNSKNVTLISGGTFDSNGLIRHHDVFSIDGVTWYLIDVVYSDGTIILETPYIATTGTTQPVYISRPTYASILLLPGEHGGLCFDSALPMFAVVDAMPGALVTGWEAQKTGGGSSSAQIVYPRHGHIIVRNIRFNYHKTSSTISATGTRCGGGANTGTAASLIQEFDLHCKNEGVDSYAPYGMVGRIEVTGGYYEATNDNQFMITTDGALFSGSTLVGNATCLLEAAGILPIQQRMLSAGSQRFILRGCYIRINHPLADPSSVSMVAGTGSASTYVLDNCVLEFITISKANAAVLVSTSGLAASVNMELNHCSILSSGTGTLNLVKADTYTGAGLLTANLCKLGGAANGGGGTFTITKNSCVA